MRKPPAQTGIGERAKAHMKESAYVAATEWGNSI